MIVCMAESLPRLFTIPSSAPFLRTLLTALLDGQVVPGFPDRRDPLSLAQATLYLPTRRACRLARDLFLEVLEVEAAILPHITAIGDIDEDEFIFAQAAHGLLPEATLSAPESLRPLERKLLLARLILTWAASPDVQTTGAPLVANNPAVALALAGDLARLIDDMITRNVSWEAFEDGLVPTDLDRYWEITLKFLRHVRDFWPGILADLGKIEPAERRDFLIAAEAERLRKARSGPVIAAGSTASMPSTALLLDTIARLPHGAVVLPGLDTDLDEMSWDQIGGPAKPGNQHDSQPAYGHPQFAMQAFLRRLGVTRETVTVLGERAAHGRELYVSEAFRPAPATERWQTRVAQPSFQTHLDAALANFTVVEAATQEEEAHAIAVILRDAVRTGEKTAALITPDRALARRVLAALERWQVAVDDSGGDSAAETPAGLFARLTAQTGLGGCAPVPLLALLKHPLCRLGKHEFGDAPAAALLERAILRGPRPRPGTDGLRRALGTLRAQQDGLHARDPRRALTDQDLALAEDLVARLAAALAPLETLKSKTTTLAEIAARHRACIANLSCDHRGLATALVGRDGDAVARMFDDIADSPVAGALPVALGEYPDLFDALSADSIVRRPGAAGARVRIYGLLEARLQYADRVVLGGLTEGVWPPETRSDPWLSRPMRQQLGLDLPERRIGLSAHDFAQALGAPEVFLTRPAKLAGAPVVASRFLQRLAAIAGEARWQTAVQRGNSYLHWARKLDRPTEEPRAAERPAPRPPLAARPKRLTVTEIEHWLRDPYTIYAKHILKLGALERVDATPGARDRGTLIHTAIADFTEKFAVGLPDDPLAELLRIGQQAFAPLADYPEAQAFWWPRFERVAEWFVGWERKRRANLVALHAEKRGRIAVTPDFELAARADRIERLADGRYAIVDYKTGQLPSEREVKAGLAPQLTLEAAILREGGFRESCGIPEGASIGELIYLRLSGGDPAGEPQPRAVKDTTPDAAADEALARLRTVVERFAQIETPYLSFVRPKWVGRTYSDYDHLARVKEWSASGGLGEGDEE
jgi:ATP-dependent helicase/nuclease subunit B